jgi:hypothetical protein
MATPDGEKSREFVQKVSKFVICSIEDIRRGLGPMALKSHPKTPWVPLVSVPTIFAYSFHNLCR